MIFQKKIPSKTWTHPSTSIVISYFWRRKHICTAPRTTHYYQDVTNCRSAAVVTVHSVTLVFLRALLCELLRDIATIDFITARYVDVLSKIADDYYFQQSRLHDDASLFSVVIKSDLTRFRSCIMLTFIIIIILFYLFIYLSSSSLSSSTSLSLSLL